jgi:hypothetical protein
MRIMGVTATSALLAILAWTLLSFYPDHGEEVAVPAAPASTAEPDKKKQANAKKKPKAKFTRAQRRARAGAVATLAELGYRPVTLKTYKPDNVLRVLIGKGEGGRRAFFFAGTTYVGNDAADDSAAIEVTSTGNRSVALAYGVFGLGDKPCCPGAKARVRFRWDGESLAAQSAIPPAEQRRAPAG